jgi:hypothetical protein
MCARSGLNRFLKDGPYFMTVLPTDLTGGSHKLDLARLLRRVMVTSPG